MVRTERLRTKVAYENKEIVIMPICAAGSCLPGKFQFGEAVSHLVLSASLDSSMGGAFSVSAPLQKHSDGIAIGIIVDELSAVLA
jgi:hypothetical protein